MEIRRDGDTIYLKGKILNELDRRVLDFVNVIPCRYVIISGYVAILFGRSRTTEDIDLFLDIKSGSDFSDFYKAVTKIGFKPFNARDEEEAYELVNEDIPVRFIFNDELYPNFEIKLPKDNVDKESLRKRVEVVLDNGKLYVSPLELQIGYKMYLGSDKDIDDARHLYLMLKEQLDMKELKYIVRSVKVKGNIIKKVLGEDFDI